MYASMCMSVYLRIVQKCMSVEYSTIYATIMAKTKKENQT